MPVMFLFCSFLFFSVCDFADNADFADSAKNNLWFCKKNGANIHRSQEQCKFICTGTVTCFEACFVITPLSPGNQIFEGKVPRIRGNLVHFPCGNEERKGTMRIPWGKVPWIRDKLMHFPLIGWTKNAGRIAAEAIVQFCSRGKCLEFAANWCTFPGRTDQEWTMNAYRW